MEKLIEQYKNVALWLNDINDTHLEDFIKREIKAFNDTVSSHHQRIRKTGAMPLHVLLKTNDGAVCGGLIAKTYWNWLDLKDFWLHKDWRQQGYGSEMLRLAEVEGVKRGCRWAKVETFSFQARTFYEKYGYHVVGQLDNYPPQETLFWLRKTLL